MKGQENRSPRFQKPRRSGVVSVSKAGRHIFPAEWLLQYNTFEMEITFRFDPIDWERMRLIMQLPPEKRVRLMLSARELAVGLIRGRMRKQFPALSPEEINLKLLEELERAS